MVLFELSDDIHVRAPQLYDRTPAALQQDVEIIKEWMRGQPHLPEIMDDKKIQNFLILNKCSIERAKQKIDMYYTVRSLLPDWYDNMNPSRPHMKETFDWIYWIPLPKLTKEMYRVSVFRLRNLEIADKLNPQTLMSIMLNLEELRLMEDYMVGDVAVFDAKGISVTYLTKVTPSLVSKCYTIYEKVYSTPLRKIIIFNSPSYINTILLVLKAVLKPKIFERIHVRTEGAEILTEYFPKEILPKELGGEERSLEELHGILKKSFEAHQADFDRLDKLKIKDSLRPQKLKNDEVLGFYGNFKKLDVD